MVETAAFLASEAAAQEQMLPFLLNPNSYSRRPKNVRLVQTHSSFVFIAPPFVFKIKKPVNFGFLDFSSLEKRRYFCEREVELNRRLCPRMYLGVVPISIKAGRFTFGEGEAVVEYAVKMRKLSDRYFLDKLVERDEVVPGDLDRIAIALRSFYQAQQPSEEIEAWGRIDRLKISTDENFRQTEALVGPCRGLSVSASEGGLQSASDAELARDRDLSATSRSRPVKRPEVRAPEPGSTDAAALETPNSPAPATISRPAFETIRSYTDEFYARRAGLFDSRVREKWIRDCHGDLHLEHIHITPRALHIYDCIEFNDRLRYVDVANDAAFLAMDLDYEGRPDLARYFVSKLAAALNDPGMGQLMDFYKCYRAYVRGKVESLHSVAHAAPESERRASADRARRYFRLALQYAVAGSRPLVAVVMGRIASGKSTLASALAAELGWPVFSSDRVRKEMAGFPLYERSSEAARSRLYSSAMTRKTYERLLSSAIAQAEQGRSVLLDATFATRAHRRQLETSFAAQGIAFRFLEAQADDGAVKQRLREREAKPDEISDARLEDFVTLTGLYEPPTELTPGLMLPVQTTAPLEQTVMAALNALAQAQVNCPLTAQCN
jgi:hypothetical protein